MVSNRNLLSQGSIFRGKLLVAGRKHDCLLSDIGFAGRICVFFWGVVSTTGLISGLGARWFGSSGSPYERDCYLGASLESQTTN